MKPQIMDLTPAEKAALKAFAERNGRRWKARLLDLWMSGQETNEPEGAALRRFRNRHGPSRLARLSSRDLA